MLLDSSHAARRREHGHRPDAGASGTPASRARRPVLVEYLGAPGSGKTTLCAAVVSELRRDGFTITTREAYFDWIRQPLPKKLRAILAGGLRTWLFTAVLVYYFFSYCTLRGRSLLKVIYELTCMQAWLARTLRHSPCSAVILDEFACHRLAFRLRDSRCIEAAGAQLTRLLFLFYPPCDVHWILKTVPVGVAAERISRRPMLHDRNPKPIETLPPLGAQAILDQHTRLAQFMFEAIQSRFGANAHLVDGASPLGDQVRQTKELLAGLLSAGMTAEHANR